MYRRCTQRLINNNYTTAKSHDHSRWDVACNVCTLRCTTLQSHDPQPCTDVARNVSTIIITQPPNLTTIHAGTLHATAVHCDAQPRNRQILHCRYVVRRVSILVAAFCPTIRCNSPYPTLPHCFRYNWRYSSFRTDCV